MAYSSQPLSITMIKAITDQTEWPAGGSDGAAGHRPSPLHSSPSLPSQGEAAQRAFRRLGGQAGTAVIEDGCKAVPAPEHAVDRLGNRGRAGEREALPAEPGVPVIDERSAPRLPGHRDAPAHSSR